MMVQLKIKREREKCEETLDTWRIERNLLKPRRKERSQIKPTTPHTLSHTNQNFPKTYQIRNTSNNY